MQYDDYRNRVLKVARVFSWIRRHTIMLLVIFITIACLIGATLFLKGTVLFSQYPDDMIYGDIPSPNAIAFLSPVSFEYRTENGDWTKTIPQLPGNYQVRSIGIDITGNPRYGKVNSFTIVPKQIEVTVSNGQVVYGEMPNVSAKTVFGDRVVCERFIYEDILQAQTTVTPIQDEIRILSSNDADVTDAYEITVATTSISIVPRKITVTVEDTSQIYDGTSLSYDKYAITEGTLVNGDILQAVFYESLTDVGSIPNTPELCVLTEDTKDITHHYQINQVIGKLTVEHRPLIVESGKISTIYNGQEVSNGNWIVSNTTPLVSGHQFRVKTTASFTDAGVHENHGIFHISDEAGDDKTNNYSIFVQKSTIEILPKPIQVTAPSQTWEYDGKEHRATNLSVSGLLAGHTYSVVESTAIQNVGTVVNTVKVDIFAGNRNVSKNYDVQILPGNLTVTARPIIVQPQDVVEYYCGAPVFGGEAILSPDSPRQLANEHYLVSTSTDSLINVGTTTSKLATVRVMYQGQDVTENYTLEMRKGSITVLKRPIQILASDAEKIYDGTPLTLREYDVVAIDPLTFALVAGHRVDAVVFDGSQTDVGSSANRLTAFKILDENDAEKTKNYEVTIEDGTLTVTKRPITVVSGSAEKIYDGTPLVCHDPIVITEGTLVADHSLNMEATGKQTDVGDSENFINGDILDAEGRVVTANYEVTYSLGTLRVYTTNTTIVFKAMSDKSERVYFRIMSYGDYIGQDNWTNAPAYSKLLDGTYSYQYLTAIALKNAGYTPANIQIQSFISSYPLPYHMAQGNYNYQIQTNDTVGTGPSLAEYSLGYYSYQGDGLDLIGNLDSYSDEELEYRAFVYDTYLRVDDETKAFMKQIIESENLNPDDPKIIEKVAQYIQSAAVYDLNIANDLDKESNMIIAFLKEYKKGVCRHYAAAATVLYRALGIPARYTVGFAEQTVAGEWIEVGAIGHAWTEVYIDGVGWIPIEVTAGSNDGGSSGGSGSGSGGGSGSGSGSGFDDIIQKENLILAPCYQYKIYDGTPLEATNQLQPNDILEKLLQQGYTYEVTIVGSQTEVGKGESKITEFRLYDSQHTDVTDRHTIVFEKGVLEVLGAQTKLIHVYLYQLQKYYDGTELSFGPNDYEYEGLDIGHRLELDLKISLKDAGIISLSEMRKNREIYAEYRVFSGDVDVTHLYTLIFEAPMGNSERYVPIRIDPRPLELTANSVSKNDDGTSLKPQGATMTMGSLAPGHELSSVTVTGSQSGIGKSMCFVVENSVVIVDQSGTNVTKNYSISYLPGFLEIYDSDSQ